MILVLLLVLLLLALGAGPYTPYGRNWGWGPAGVLWLVLLVLLVLWLAGAVGGPVVVQRW